MDRVLHFDCFSGISGDMTLAALLDVGVPEEVVRRAIDGLALGASLEVTGVRKNGFAAKKIAIHAPDEHAHRHLTHIRDILRRGVANGGLTASGGALAERFFERLGQAEAESHGIAIEEVHFHEVGAIDSICDFAGVAAAIDWLKPTRVTASPVAVGGGWVDCEHGRLPVPAPATARLLVGVPIASTTIQAELTTPTGAAILAVLVNEYTPQLAMKLTAVGLGAGTRDFAEQPNLLRILLGEVTEPTGGAAATALAADGMIEDIIWQVETNLDDAPAEIIAYAADRLLHAGALDVFTTPVFMKKGRPGVLLTFLCDAASRSALEHILFRETGSFGVRRSERTRAKLQRKPAEVELPWGRVRGKLGWSQRIRVFAPEFDDCARVAQAAGVPLRSIYQEAIRRFQEQYIERDAGQS